ncbi:MAG: hypothetical protein PHY29_03135 [Syntrophales bacterium]|nr:hypothetical protein [Syntrophales bacterium]
MASKEPKTVKHAFDADVEVYLTSVYRDEVQTSQTNTSGDIDNFEMALEMFEGQRTAKDYEWYSNLSLKEGTSILLTDASTAVNQYFQSRDFVEVVLEGDDPNDRRKAKAAKKTINKTLNNRRLYHYMKFTRAKNINNMASHVYALCNWEQEIEKKQTGFTRKWKENGVDEYGRIMWEPMDEPQYTEVVKLDMFNYDVYDARNVFVSDEYVYNIQDKRWIIFRSETTYEEMKALEQKNGYINLNLIKEMSRPVETETSKESTNKGKNRSKPSKTPIKPFDLYTRLGKVWAVVEERTEEGIPKKMRPGYDRDGNILADAELVEAIICFAVSGSNSVLARFDATPYIDSRNSPYKPVCRGICYPHPTKDTGLGEGQLLLDLDSGINDAFNLAFDTAKLKTIPTTISDKFAADDNDSIFFEPGHNIAIEGGKKAFDFLEVPNSLGDMINMIALVKNHTDQVTSTYPTTMGNVGGVAASTTATAIAGAESRTNMRQNYKAITFEYTFLVDLYWMILQMTWRFARPTTALKLMGEDAYYFDPDADYTYTPVTSAIETEYNKYRKLQFIQGLMQTVAAIPNPDTPKILNVLQRMIFEILGPDYDRMNEASFSEGNEARVAAMQGGGTSGSTPAITAGTSNQTGIPMSGGEMNARQIMQQTGGIA